MTINCEMLFQTSTLDVVSCESAAAQFQFQIHTITHSEYLSVKRDVSQRVRYGMVMEDQETIIS